VDRTRPISSTAPYISLASWHTRVERRRHFHLTRISGNLLALVFSNHLQAPVSPLNVTIYYTPSAIGAPSYISKAPLCSVRRYNPVSPQTPDPWTPTNRQSTAYFDNNRTLLNGSIRWALSATKQYSYYYSWSSDSVKAVDGRTPSGPNSWAQGQGKS
jgi:hypothetical protein